MLLRGLRVLERRRRRRAWTRRRARPPRFARRASRPCRGRAPDDAGLPPAEEARTRRAPRVRGGDRDALTSSSAAPGPREAAADDLRFRRTARGSAPRLTGHSSRCSTGASTGSLPRGLRAAPHGEARERLRLLAVPSRAAASAMLPQEADDGSTARDLAPAAAASSRSPPLVVDRRRDAIWPGAAGEVAVEDDLASAGPTSSPPLAPRRAVGRRGRDHAARSR